MIVWERDAEGKENWREADPGGTVDAGPPAQGNAGGHVTPHEGDPAAVAEGQVRGKGKKGRRGAKNNGKLDRAAPESNPRPVAQEAPSPGDSDPGVLQRDTEGLGDSVESLRAKLEEVEGEKARLEAEVARIGAELERVGPAAEAAEKLLEDLREARAAASAQDEAVASRDALAQKLEEVEAELVQAVASRDEAVTSAEAARERLREAELELEEVVASRAASDARVQNLEAQLGELAASQGEAESERVEQLQKTLREAVVSRDQAVASRDALAQKLEEVEAELEQAVVSRDQAAASAEAVGERTAQVEVELERAAASRDEAVASAEAAREQLAEVEAELEKLRGELERAVASRDEAVASGAAAEESIHALEVQLKEARELMGETQLEQEDLLEQLSSVRASLAKVFRSGSPSPLSPWVPSPSGPSSLSGFPCHGRPPSPRYRGFAVGCSGVGLYSKPCFSFAHHARGFLGLPGYRIPQVDKLPQPRRPRQSHPFHLVRRWRILPFKRYTRRNTLCDTLMTDMLDAVAILRQ